MKKIEKLQKKMLALTVMLALAMLSSCNLYERFEEEQYKPVFSITSHEDSYNVFNAVIHLGRDTTTKYVSAYVGGTHAVTEDINIELIHDPTVMKRYKNACLLPSHMYRIDSYNITIPAGSHEGQIKVELMPEGLSPDSAYFIPLNVYSYKGGELNPKKNYVLYRVLIKNRYARQDATTTYAMKAHMEIPRDEGSRIVPADINMNRDAKPIGKRKIRLPAGNQFLKSTTEAAQLAFVQNECITLEVDADSLYDGSRKVKVATYKYAKVEQLDNDSIYSNIFKITYDPLLKKWYKTFLVNYRYCVPIPPVLPEGPVYTKNPTDTIVYTTIKKELKLEFKPEQEKEEDFM
jgi:hypothetical protein